MLAPGSFRHVPSFYFEYFLTFWYNKVFQAHLDLSCPSPGVIHFFPKEPCFLLVRNGFREKNAGCAHFYWCVFVLRLFQQSETENEYMYPLTPTYTYPIHADIHMYTYICLYSYLCLFQRSWVCTDAFTSNPFSSPYLYFPSPIPSTPMLIYLLSPIIDLNKLLQICFTTNNKSSKEVRIRLQFSLLF